MRRGALIALAIAFAALETSCSVNEYCVNCATGDGGNGDGGDQGDGKLVSDGSMPPDACTPTGQEICDGTDNDCDGKTDENTAQEPLPMVGDDCSSNVGECTAGKVQCVSGKLTCSGKTATPEICDGLDNNCDGTPDNGDPGGGGICGTDMGECIAGVNHCVNGTVQCVGSLGPQPELCDGKDNDCDGMFDESLPPLGSCGPTQGNTGECKLGTLMCAGGGTVCVGAVFPTFELCDNLDQDCDGDPHNGYDLQNDAHNCGTCGHVCSIAHGTAACKVGACAVGACDPGFFDIDKDPSNGCEYACDFQGPNEACNGLDDNCNGQVDENLTVPDICDHDGACAGTVATCDGLAGFRCHYGANVSTDSNGDIIPESTCDDLDNDCNGKVDDPFPAKGLACHDTGVGICMGTGANVCNTAHDGVECKITKPGKPKGTETCNGLDDDCNGVVDDGSNTGNLDGQSWVVMASGHQIMQFEAARPDAGNLGANDAGSMTTRPCSKAGVLPWTDVTAPQAAAACGSVGAHLCSEEEWQRACSVVTPTVYPVLEPSANNGAMYFEAEDFFASAYATSTGGTAATRSWEPDYTIGYSGTMALRANPDTGADIAANVAVAQAPRLDFEVDFETTGNHYVWVRMFAPNGNGDRVRLGIVQSSTTPAAPTQSLSAGTNATWVWVQSGSFNVTTKGVGLVELFMRRDGIKVDAIYVTRSNSGTAPTNSTGPGNTYAYDASPNAYAANTCNGLDYDTDPGTAGNQDDIIATGALGTCDAAWTGGKIFDLTGNAQEWTAPRVPGINPIRGGASNDVAGGLTCQLSFAAADDAFFFPNVGFRCCR